MQKKVSKMSRGDALSAEQHVSKTVEVTVDLVPVEENEKCSLQPVQHVVQKHRFRLNRPVTDPSIVETVITITIDSLCE